MTKIIKNIGMKLNCTTKEYTKPIPITKILYLIYSFLFLFNNISIHFIYTKNIFCIVNINTNMQKKTIIIMQLMIYKK